ncbi:MAG TPA: ABC transporter substrate-binding protein [Acidimicrobiales bacterium]|nr:ABC transporter substrate-binding protein [Acidimicrobiales bacterium]
MSNRKRKIVGVGFGVIVAATALAACSSSSPAPTSTSASSRSLISASECAANKAAGTINYVSPFGFDGSAGIIDVFAAQKLGYFKDLCLNTQMITNSEDSTTLVSSGAATTTNVGSAADFLVAAASGADITAVATYGDTSDYCIITRKNITSLKELEGKTLGYHFVQEAPDLEMLAAAGVDISKIDMVDTTNYDPNQILQGKIDAVDCYRSNEPLTLKAEGAKFNEFTPAMFGVTGTYNVEFFNTKFLDAHYGAAKDWMRADLHAFAYCEQNKDACVNIEGQAAKAAGAEFITSHEQQVWGLESVLSEKYTLPGEGIGVESQAEWQPEAQEVVKFKLIKGAVPSLSKYQNTTMVASLYSGKTLIWP